MAMPASAPRRKKPKPSTHETIDGDMELSSTEKEYEEHIIRQRPIQFKEYNGGDSVSSGGLVIGLLSLWKNGKSIGASLWAFFNSLFKKYMGPETREVLTTGTLPEIEQILVVDTEETWKRDLDHGYLGTILKPIIKSDIKIKIESTPLLRKREKVKEGEIVNVSKDFDVDKMRENFEAAVWHAAEDYGPETLIIIDSMSDYKDSITDEQEEMFGKTITRKFKKRGEKEDEETNLDRKFYRYRNKWWINVLMKLRTSGAWVVETYKMEKRDEEWRWKEVKYRSPDNYDKFVTHQIRLPAEYPVWVSKTEYRVDQGYAIRDWYDMETGTIKPMIRTDWYKHRHSTMQFSDLDSVDLQEKHEEDCLFPYPQGDRMAMMYLIEDMAPALLQKVEPEEEEAMWGKYAQARNLDDEIEKANE